MDRQAIGTRLLHLPNVLGYFVGHKLAGGSDTGELSLVCLVTEKGQVKPSGRIPPHVDFRLTSRSKGRIKTDVVAVDRFRRASGIACGPGDAIAGRSRGTVGISLGHPTFGPVVTSAGHVFVDSGWTGIVEYGIDERPPIELRNVPSGESFGAELLKVVVTSAADFALLRPQASFPALNVYQDRVPLGGPYHPSADEIGAPLTVLAAAGERRTMFRGMHGGVRVGDEGLILDVLLTDRCTAGGDSGAVLVDGYKRVWGLLVGFCQQFSVYMSPFALLRHENAEFH